MGKNERWMVFGLILVFLVVAFTVSQFSFEKFTGKITGNVGLDLPKIIHNGQKGNDAGICPSGYVCNGIYLFRGNKDYITTGKLCSDIITYTEEDELNSNEYYANCIPSSSGGSTSGSETTVVECPLGERKVGSVCYKYCSPTTAIEQTACPASEGWVLSWYMNPDKDTNEAKPSNSNSWNASGYITEPKPVGDAYTKARFGNSFECWCTKCADGYTYNSSSKLCVAQNLDTASNWFVLGDNSKIYKYNSDWTYTGTSYSLTQKTDIIWDGTNWWVVGDLGRMIYKYNSDWTYTSELYPRGAPASEEYNTIKEIAWNGTNWFVLGDNSKIYKYNSDWTYTGTSYSLIGSENFEPLTLFFVPKEVEQSETPEEPTISVEPVGYCNAISEGGNKIPAKTRIIDVGDNNKLKYCDPLTLTYKEVLTKGTICVEDYECDTNVCIDGKCTSISEALEKQASLLKKIWCWIQHPISETERQTCQNEEA